MQGPPLFDRVRWPGWWHGGAVGELEKLRAEVGQLRAAVDWRDRRIGELELRLRGAPAPSPGVVEAMRKALEGWRPHT